MRMIGHLEGEANARNFADYLYVQGIDNQIEHDKGGQWAVWIHREEDLERGRVLLNNFAADPNDPRFLNHAATAEQLREQKHREQIEYEKRMKRARNIFRPMMNYGFGPVTALLILISVLVYIDGHLFRDYKFVGLLEITHYDLIGVRDMSIWQSFIARVSAFHELLPEVRSGQAWRLVTPIFIHFSFLHIFFNMLWLRDLGSMIEARQGSLLLILMVLVVAVISNLAEFMFIGNQEFGGMSGVVYGLLGYIWIRGKRDPGSGLFLQPTTVTMMIIWLVVCMIGVMGAVANAAHVSGLLVGMLWGYLSSLRMR